MHEPEGVRHSLDPGTEGTRVPGSVSLQLLRICDESEAGGAGFCSLYGRRNIFLSCEADQAGGSDLPEAAGRLVAES